MQRIQMIAGSLVLLLLAGCASLPAGPASLALTAGTGIANATEPAAELVPQSRSITVSGSAEVKVVPDEVVLTIGIETWNKNLTLAKANNDDIVKKSLGIVEDAGIEDKYVQTDYLQIEPRYENYNTYQNLLGYFVNQTIGITLKDISKYEGLLSQLLEAGVNHVYRIEFRTTELAKHRDEARRLAIRAARDKAGTLAQELGQDVGEPLAIREVQPSGWTGYFGYASYAASNVSQNAVQGGGAAAVSDATIALGQIAVSANVSVDFALK